MSKKVLINGRFTSHHFAIRNVIYSIAKQLVEDPQLDVYILLNKDSDISDFEKLNIKILKNPCPADSAGKNHLFTMFVLPWILLFHRFDLVIYPQICIFLFNPCKSLLYIHDLIEYHVYSQSRKKMLFRKIAYPYVCRKADAIVAISENTKKDIIDIFGTRENKIIVAYDGKSEDLKPIDRKEAETYIKEKYGVENYIYYIGYITHPQKNLIYLINEFAVFHKNHPDYQLVFAGPRGNHAEMILSKVKELGLSDVFKYLGKVPYEDLPYLYSACQVFCFPSLYEGFGMPVLEAMSCGALVITSNRSSLPEIMPYEDSLVDPETDGELSQKLEQMINSDRTGLSARNIERSNEFSWHKHGLILRNLIWNIFGNRI